MVPFVIWRIIMKNLVLAILLGLGLSACDPRSKVVIDPEEPIIELVVSAVKEGWALQVTIIENGDTILNRKVTRLQILEIAECLNLRSVNSISELKIDVTCNNSYEVCDSDNPDCGLYSRAIYIEDLLDYNWDK